MADLDGGKVKRWSSCIVRSDVVPLNPSPKKKLPSSLPP